MGALQALEGQRESLNRSITKIDEVKTNANQSKQLLRVGFESDGVCIFSYFRLRSLHPTRPSL